MNTGFRYLKKVLIKTEEANLMLISPSLKVRLWYTSYGILQQHLRQPTHEKFICDFFLLVGVLARHLDGSNIHFMGHCRHR